MQFAGREPLFLVESGSDLNVSSTINSTATARKERGGTLILSGDNDVAAARQLTGAFTINAGTVIATHGNAFGTEPGGTVTVNRRAALVLDATAGNLDFGNKAFTLNGYGLNDDLAGNNTARGSLRVIGGTTAAPRTVTVGTNATVFTINQGTTPNVIDVTDSTTLNLLAVVTGNNNLTKIGGGNADLRRQFAERQHRHDQR